MLAPNLRAARHLRTAIATHATCSDELTDLAGRVLHWRAWTAGLHQEALLQGRDERVLLRPLQERLLWEQILQADPEVEQSKTLLDLCISACTLLYQHDAVAAFVGERIANATGDVARFVRWFRTFEQRCREDQLLPAAALETALAAGSQSATNSASTIVLCSLADLAPAQEYLLTALARHGANLIESPRQAAGPAHTTLLRCQNDTDELQHFARHLTDALRSPERPDYAVIVPDLSSARDRIDRILREHLHPVFSAIFADDRRPLWEFSTGRPLPVMGVIADALLLLTWTNRDLDGGEISRLLRSPNLDWPIDADVAASLDAALLRRHSHLRGTWSPRSAAQLLHRPAPAFAEALLQRTGSWSSLHHSTGGFASFTERARHILRDFGWFRSGDRSSTEFQAVTRFEHLLDDLASLDLIGDEAPSWSAFMHRLTASARDTTFAPENTGAPIQILTPDESTGIQSANLWFLHADEDRLSSRTTPHPLLPQYLQQQHGMPGTDAVHDQLQLRRQVERIASIAPSTTFSYAHIGEAGEQRPSSAVTARSSLELRDADPTGTLDRLHASAGLQTFQDGELIPLQFGNGTEPIPGGVSILQSQAACAFRAFAERRLGSATLDTRDLGMDARDRGSLLHNALQIFWQDAQDSKTLQRLIADNHLAAAIHRAVDLALRTHRDPTDRWTSSYLQIQRIRLESLLDRWLRKEAGRPDFRIVEFSVQRDHVHPLIRVHPSPKGHRPRPPRLQNWPANHQEVGRRPSRRTATPALRNLRHATDCGREQSKRGRHCLRRRPCRRQARLRLRATKVGLALVRSQSHRRHPRHLPGELAQHPRDPRR